MDAHNVHLTTMSADNMINNFTITDRKHEHSFIPVKKTSSWVYNYFSPHGYFGGSAAVVEVRNAAAIQPIPLAASKAPLFCSGTSSATLRLVSGTSFLNAKALRLVTW